MKQTPLMKLIDFIDNYEDIAYHVAEDIKAKATELLAEEREAIIDAYIECWMNDGGNGSHKVKEAQHYYTQTYGGGDE